jgi:hypothetical protein
MSGAADVINAQGQLMQDQQQAYLTKEQVRSARIENRKKALDESLYERAVTPTAEDERERQRIETLRRSRNEPDLTEIWSAKALNNLLDAIQKQHAQRVEGPVVPVDGTTLKRINMSGGRSNASLALLRDSGRLDWPEALTEDEFASYRKDLDGLSARAYEEVQSGSVKSATTRAMTKATNALASKLKKSVDTISPNDYIAAKRFIGEMDGTIRALHDPSVASSASPKWPSSGVTVAQLTDQMTQRGLRFAPAVAGDESAYTALHRAMVAYHSPQTAAKWDPYAK